MKSMPDLTDNLTEARRQMAHISEAIETILSGKDEKGSIGLMIYAFWKETEGLWAIMILAFNLNSAMKHLVLGGNWVTKLMKAIRFALINLPGRIIKRSRKLIVRLTGRHVSNELLLMIRSRMLCLSGDSYG